MNVQLVRKALRVRVSVGKSIFGCETSRWVQISSSAGALTVTVASLQDVHSLSLSIHTFFGPSLIMRNLESWVFPTPEKAARSSGT